MPAGRVGQYLQALAPVTWSGAATGERPRNEREAIRQVASQFEAIFLGQLLKEMHATTFQSGLFGSDRTSQMYREMHDEALAETLASTGSLGIGKMLYEELTRAEKLR